MAYALVLAVSTSVSLLAYLFWCLLLRPRYFSALAKLPGPDGNHILLGQSRRLLHAYPTQVLLDWMDHIPNQGFIRYLSFLNTEFLLPTSPEALNAICNTETNNFVKSRPVRALMTRAMGEGMIFAEGQQHKHQRSSLQRAFGYSQLKLSYTSYWSKSQQLRSVLERTITSCTTKDGSPATVEMYDLYARVALDLLCIGTFGCNFDVLSNPDHPLNSGATAYRTSTARTGTAVVRFVVTEYLPAWMLNLCASFLFPGLRETYEPARACFREAIDTRRHEIAAGKTVGQDMLSLAITNGSFKDAEIVDNMLGMYFAGTHSTAAALTWATYPLCKHPEKQERLRNEVLEALANVDESESADAKAIASLPYLTAIVHETLRLYPPIPLTVRENIRPTTIAGVHIPAGTKIALAPGATNRCAANWGPDARDFRPERWLNDCGKFDRHGASKNGSNWDVLTFLHGPRNCIGQDMARAEIAVVLAVMFSSFKFGLADPKFVAVPRGNVIMRPAHGLPVVVQPL